MVFACGLSGYSVGVFHLANHAFFKALLFLVQVLLYMQWEMSRICVKWEA